MSKRLQGLIAGVLIGAMLTSGVAFAKQASETINVIYDNIKILIDGKEYQPKDVNGNVVEPFIYKGTTYLPVRAIANAFDKEVDWEAQTSTVTLGSKNYDWLDQMGYVDYETTGAANSFSAIPSRTQTSDGKFQNRGIQFYLNDYDASRETEDGSSRCSQSISYLLNNNYKDFVGSFSYINNSNRSMPSKITIYGDGKVICNSPNLSYGMQTADFKVNVENVKILKIQVDYINSRSDNSYVSGNWLSYPCIADARLSKK